MEKSGRPKGSPSYTQIATRIAAQVTTQNAQAVFDWRSTERKAREVLEGIGHRLNENVENDTDEMEIEMGIESHLAQRQEAFKRSLAEAWGAFSRDKDSHDYRTTTDGSTEGPYLHDTTLYPHQTEAVKGLAYLESTAGGCLLADDMGLGKTLEAIGLMAYRPVKKTLVVVPSSMVPAWRTAIEQHLPEQPLVVHAENRRSNEWKLPWSIVLTTYDIAREEFKEQMRYEEGLSKLIKALDEGEKTDVSLQKSYIPTTSTVWQRIIFDEAHRLRNNTQTRQMALALESMSKVLLTGTPFQNQNSDIQAYLEILNVRPWTCKDTFRRVFVERGGIKSGWVPSDENLDRAAILSLTLRSVMIRRVRTDHFDGSPILNTPGSDNKKVMITPSEEERSAQALTRFYWDLTIWGFQDLDPLKDFSREDRLKEITKARYSAVHPACPGAYAEFPWIESVAESDDMEEDRVTEMIAENFERFYYQREEDLVRVSRAEFKADRVKDWHLSSKLKKAVSLAQEAISSGLKILFFSEFLSAVDCLSAALTGLNIKHAEFNGTMNRAERIATIESFEGNGNTVPNDTMVMLLTSAGGEGITLVQASVVVLLTPSWNPFVDLQMAHRADRIGQTKFVHVFRLVNDASFEQHVSRTQEKKLYNARLLLEDAQIAKAKERVKEWTQDDFLHKLDSLSH